jgi:hypothetical protein
MINMPNRAALIGATNPWRPEKYYKPKTFEM